MSIKPLLFACAIAAGLGCQADRTARDNASAGAGAAADTTRTNAAGNTVHVTGAANTSDQEYSGPSHAQDFPAEQAANPPAPQRIDQSGTTNVNTGRSANTYARRAGAARRGTAFGFGTRYNAQSGLNRTASGKQAPSGLNQTASGNGTTTNTATDTDNAGTGDTSTPQR